MQAVHQGHQSSFVSSKKKAEEQIILDNPPTQNCLESRLFNAGLGNKPDLPDILQDTARNIVNK